MVWRRKLALKLTLALMIGYGVTLLVTHADDPRLWSGEGIAFLLVAHGVASIAQLQAVGDQSTADLRTVLRMVALGFLVAGLLIMYRSLTGHLPIIG